LCSPFSFIRCRDHPDLHSFPTRRSSDLLTAKSPLRVPTQIVGASMASASSERLDDHHLVGAGERHIEVHAVGHHARVDENRHMLDRKSTRLNSSHVKISYAVFCLKKKKK